MPYAIVKLSDNSVVKTFSSLPKSFEVTINGRTRRIISPVQVGDTGLDHLFAELVEVNKDRPGVYYDSNGFSDSLSGNTVTRTYQWTAWTAQRISTYQAAQSQAEVDDIMNQRQTRAIFTLVNEVRQLKGQSTLSRNQFRTWFEGLVA